MVVASAPTAKPVAMNAIQNTRKSVSEVNARTTPNASGTKLKAPAAKKLARCIPVRLIPLSDVKVRYWCHSSPPILARCHTPVQARPVTL